MKIEEQIVLVTGAGRGLGAAIATAFAREGAHVIVNYRRSADTARELRASIGKRAVAVQADVADRQAVDRMVAEAAKIWGKPVTTIVNNALGDYSFNGDGREQMAASNSARSPGRALPRNSTYRSAVR